MHPILSFRGTSSPCHSEGSEESLIISGRIICDIIQSCFAKPVLSDTEGLNMTGHTFSSVPDHNLRLAIQFIDFEFWSRLEQRRTLAEMLSELSIRFQPPKSGRGKNKMRCALATQSLKIGNRLLAVLWIAAVNSILLEKMPDFALRIIEYG